MRNIIGISAALLLATAGTASAAPFALTSTHVSSLAVAHELLQPPKTVSLLAFGS